MSARDRLIDRNDPEWNAVVDEILAEHAHELAEKQRALDVSRLTKLTPDEQRRVRLGIDLAADKIDPEVGGE